MFKKILIFIIFCCLFTQTASAIGIGVTPGSLNFSVQAGGSDTGSLFVINTGTEVSNYKVYVDNDYADWFDISPDNFNLSANENKEVILKIQPPLSAKGEFDFIVYAVSSSPSSDFSVGSGIKVPVHTHVSNTGLMVGILLMLLVIGAGGFYYVKNKKNNGKNT
jgi:P pilus assembly chaperone PapD